MGRFGFPSPFLGCCCHLGCEPAEPRCWLWAATALSHCPTALSHRPWPYRIVPQPYHCLQPAVQGLLPQGSWQPGQAPGLSHIWGLNVDPPPYYRCYSKEKAAEEHCWRCRCGAGDTGFGFWPCQELPGVAGAAGTVTLLGLVRSPGLTPGSCPCLARLVWVLFKGPCADCQGMERGRGGRGDSELEPL